MLSSFRKGGIVQFLMGGVIIAIIVAFALDYRRSGSKRSFESECVVQVGRSCVAPRDFTTAFSLFVRPDLTAKELKRFGVRQLVIDGLVERQLLLDEARQLGISISEDKVDEELARGRFHFSMPAARDGLLPMLKMVNVRSPDTDEFNYDLYQRMVRNSARMSTKDFKINQTEELIAARMRDLIKLGVRVSETEAYSEFERARSRATVRVAQLHSRWFERFSTALSDELVRNYAANQAAEVDAAVAQQQASYAEGCPLVSEIYFAFPPAADEKDEAETRARAQRVAARAATASNQDFSILARIHSAAPSADYGGRRGCLHESEGEEAGQLIKALEGLQPGATSQLVEQARGFYLLRLEERLSPERLADVTRLWVARPLAARAAADGLTQEFARAVIGSVGAGKSLQESVDALSANALVLSPLGSEAKQAGGAARASELLAAARESRDRPQVDVSPSFTRSGVATPVYNALQSAAAKQLAFSLQTVGEMHAEPIATRDGLAVMQLKEREPVKREDFDKEKAEFMRELKQKAEVEALTAHVTRLRQAREKDIVVNPHFLEEKSAADDS
ncbi:MAG: SurA N-terminal domain-containing protein [Deltaproteobacteria bacterium]